MKRYTIDGSAALESRLESICEEIGLEVVRIVPRTKLQSLALGGGYGRGEGGVLRYAQGDLPYNDLEFFLLVSGPPRVNERLLRAPIHDLEHRMSDKLGIEVEFKITSVQALSSGPTTMFSYDLLAGHRIVAGDAHALSSCQHHGDATRIPMHEATRLLMNRCSGLLFAKERLVRDSFTAEDADFVARNIAKAELALGDALLASRGAYHWSCRERHDRLERLEEATLPMAGLRDLHAHGVEFKLHPVRSSATREVLLEQHRQVAEVAWKVWAHIEQHRLGRTISSPADYADHTDKCPETTPFRNALIRLRAFGLRGWLAGQMFRYPRESLLNTLPVLLWVAEEELDTAWCSRQLVSPVAGWQDAIAVYQKLWSRYN
jgi:hypothetical protein